jgi:hypothetical protein
LLPCTQCCALTGTLLSYQINIGNNGTQTLPGPLTLTNTNIDAGTLSCNPNLTLSSLGIGQSIVCTGVHFVTAAETSSGQRSITNNATISFAGATANDTRWSTATSWQNNLNLTVDVASSISSYDTAGMAQLGMWGRGEHLDVAGDSEKTENATSTGMVGV